MGLVRHLPAREAEGTPHRLALRRSPLGDGEHRQVVGENRRHRKGEQGHKGEASPLWAARIGQRGEQGEQGGSRHGGRGCGRGRRILHVALLVMDQASDTRILAR